MSTFLLAGVPGSTLENITATTGGALQTSTNALELQINQSATLVNDLNSTTRGLQREEALVLMNIFAQYIQRMNWPYASS